MSVTLKPNNDGTVDIQVDGVTKLTYNVDGTWTTTVSPSTTDDSKKLATTELVRDLALGVDQTWQNVTASRTLGVTYTNATGKPITVVVTWNSTSGTCTVDVGGVTVFVSPTSSTYLSPVTFVVPAGQSYVVSGGTAFLRWTELR